MKIETVSVKDLGSNKLYNAYIIDIRSKEAYEKGHIQGAINIPYHELTNKIQKYGRQKTIILYCDRGVTSIRATEELMLKGYSAKSLIGGYNAYIAYNKK